MTMRIPTDEILQSGNNLIDISDRISGLLSQSSIICGAISKCYMRGGVGNRADGASIKMKEEQTCLYKKGRILVTAVSIYENKEQDLEAQSQSTASTIENGYNVSWTNRPEIQAILSVGIKSIFSIPIGLLAFLGISYLANADWKNAPETIKPLPELTEEEQKQANELAGEWKYLNTVAQINDKVPVGQKQETEQSGSGLCTYSATTTLLRRREAADGRDPTFDFGDVHKANGGNGSINGNGRWPDSSFTFSRTYTSKDAQASYQMDYIEGHSSVDAIVALLKTHPEGIMIYSPSSGGYNHAIVITDYEQQSDGSIQLYADDPVNNGNAYYQSGRVRLEDTWLYSQNKNLIENSVRVSYLK